MIKLKLIKEGLAIYNKIIFWKCICVCVNCKLKRLMSGK